MTKKDYKIIGKIMYQAYNANIRPENMVTPLDMWNFIKDALYKELAKDNPKFDKEMFCDFIVNGF